MTPSDPSSPYSPSVMTVPKNGRHIVRKGDTLWSISKNYGVSLDGLLARNDLNKNSIIHPGQELILETRARGDADTRDVRSLPGRSGNTAFIWPIDGKIAHNFGEDVKGVYQRGIVIQAKEGSQIKAACSGVVAYVDEKMTGLGKVIIIDHPGGYSSIYAHNEQNKVEKGQKIAQGDVIALVGQSGRADNPQLYFEIRRNSRSVNPVSYLH